MRLKSLHLREQNGFKSQKRKDEVHSFKIRSLEAREYRTKLAILTAEARLTLAQSKIPPPPPSNHQEIPREAVAQG
jgi:hypothetical protein